MLQSRLPIDLVDWILWGLQGVVLILAWRVGRRPASAAQGRTLTWERCVIAILVAWSWRLVYAFALASSGFWYLVPDDVARLLLSWGWSDSPYLVTWDGIWQGGTFYLHGAAMTVLQDPLVASKFVSAFYNLLPLIGIFLLTQGLYRNARLSSVAVLAAAPWWLHILLGTGTMTEMPVTGFMLAGVGLLLMALDARTGERASGRALIGAAFCFLAATAFHLVAWMMLVSFLLAFARRLLSTPKAVVRRRLPLFLAISFGYCLAWSLGCWIKFGSPLAFLAAYDANNLKHGLHLSLGMRARAYPLAFLYDAWLILPALAAGVIGACSDRDERRWRERVVIGGAAAALVILTASAIVGSASNILPVRSPVAIVAALFPIAVASVAGAWPAGWTPWRPSRTGRLAVVVVLVLAVAWVAVNHERIFERARSQQTLDSDAVAMGVWLREAAARPDPSGRLEGIVHVWVATSSAFPDYSIAYLFGRPEKTRLHPPSEAIAQVLSTVVGGDLLVTDQPLTSAGFEKVVTIGKYQAFRVKGGASR
jgi:hypothetical protein